MQISKTDNVIFLKNVESNIIDQAFIVLKDKVKISPRNEDIDMKGISESNIIKDAENLINNEIDKNNIKYEKFKCEILSKKIKILKTMNIITVVILIISLLLR